MKAIEIKPGDEFNFLTCDDFPFSRESVSSNGSKYRVRVARFKCLCGITKILSCNQVINGAIKSCGCYSKSNKKLPSKRIFSEQELKDCINNKLTYKEIATKYKCSIAIVRIRMNEYNLYKNKGLKEFVGKFNKNGRLFAKDVVKIKGKYLLLCRCCCGNEIPLRVGLFNTKSSCGCLRPRLDGKITKTVVHKIRAKARDRGITCTVTLELLQKLFDYQNGMCVYSGLPITFPSSSTDNRWTASLDRIDSSKGYIEGNVQWVHKRINSMKNDMTEKEFIELCTLVFNKMILNECVENKL